MSYIIVGLGNPGEEYEKTRHNSGRIVLEYFQKKNKFPDWEFDKKLDALVSEGKIGKDRVLLILPEAFMNKSGDVVKKLLIPMATPPRKSGLLTKLVVVHDDLDLPLGALKIVFNRGGGGHKGVESIIRSIKTKAFTRIRIGISPTTSSGKIKKPQPKAGPPRAEKGAKERAVVDFILGKFKPAELKKLQGVYRKVGKALGAIIIEGRERAMTEFN